MNDNDMLDHINSCDGVKDIITTRFYTHEELEKKFKKDNKEKIISISATFDSKRPSTR
tara:strand:- start:72 stop:245 length:174 start_codon:yes stop_codon:yes gene_type:complete